MICSKLLDRTGGGGFALVSDWTASCTPESIRIKWDWCWGAWLDATGLNRRRAQFSQSSAVTNRLIVKEFFIEGELPTYEVMVQMRQSKSQIDDNNWRWLIYDDLLRMYSEFTSGATQCGTTKYCSLMVSSEQHCTSKSICERIQAEWYYWC